MNKKVICKICHITDNTGINSDMNEDIHEGFTIGKGKVMYWLIIWHQSGHCTVYRKDNQDGLIRRWISGDQEISIHFK